MHGTGSPENHDLTRAPFTWHGLGGFMLSVPAPIFGFNAARPSIVDEVVRRIGTQVRDPLLVLNEAAYLETKRLQSTGHPALAEWRGLASQLGRMSDAELRERLRFYAEHYAWD